jgi:hypothetical protein
VSTPEKPDPVDAWKYVDKLLADEELERLDKRNAEEVQQELRAEGVDPAHIASPEELLAKAEARAARTKTSAEQGGEADAGKTKGGTGDSAGGTVVPFRGRGPMIAALAVAAGVALFVALRPHEGSVTRGNPEAWRLDAFDDCAAHRWDACEKKLNEAKKIEPSGERDPRVVAARAAIAEGRRAGTEGGRTAP